MSFKKHTHRPAGWIAFIYAFACGVLIPWTIFLAYVLPRKYYSHNWDIVWVGFDLLELFLFALSAVLIILNSYWLSISSAMLGIVLFIDAWFDVLTSKPGKAETRSILEAILVEIPLGLISLAISIWMTRKEHHSKI